MLDFLDQVIEEENKSNVEIISEIRNDLVDVMTMAFSSEAFKTYLSRENNHSAAYLPIPITRRIFELSAQIPILRHNFAWKRHYNENRFKCMMVQARNTRKHRWRYSLYSDENMNGIPPFLLSCRRRGSDSRLWNCEYEISIAQGWTAFIMEENIVAFLRSNRMGTRWVLIEAKTKRTLMHVEFERNMLRNSPVKHKVRVLNDVGQFESLRTCQAVWMQDRYCLNFQGRVKCTSAKNFQMERDVPLVQSQQLCVDREESAQPSTTKNCDVLYQFGRLVEKSDTENKYALDFHAPFCPVVAFALAICQVSKKIAC